MVVRSAGTHALVDTRICDSTAASLLKLHPEASEFVAHHRGKQLTASDIEEADVILSASRAERQVVASMVPAARAKSFTLLEAAGLAEQAALTATTTGVFGGQWSEALNAQRGRVQIPQSTRFGRRLTDPSAVFDIKDVHTGEISKHRPVHADIRSAVDRIVVATTKN